MMGPMTLGSTRTVRGVWEILYRLQVLVQWSLKEYKEWFDTHIIKWARDLAPSSTEV